MRSCIHSRSHTRRSRLRCGGQFSSQAGGHRAENRGQFAVNTRHQTRNGDNCRSADHTVFHCRDAAFVVPKAGQNLEHRLHAGAPSCNKSADAAKCRRAYLLGNSERRSGVSGIVCLIICQYANTFASPQPVRNGASQPDLKKIPFFSMIYSRMHFRRPDVPDIFRHPPSVARQCKINLMLTMAERLRRALSRAPIHAVRARAGVPSAIFWQSVPARAGALPSIRPRRQSPRAWPAAAAMRWKSPRTEASAAATNPEHRRIWPGSRAATRYHAAPLARPRRTRPWHR